MNEFLKWAANKLFPDKPKKREIPKGKFINEKGQLKDIRFQERLKKVNEKLIK